MRELQKQAKGLVNVLSWIKAIENIELTSFEQGIDLLRRIERGELVEVVRCGECANGKQDPLSNGKIAVDFIRCGERGLLCVNDYCSEGRRKDNANG